MSSLDKIEEYLESVEEYFYSSVNAISHSIPDVHEVVNRLWIDISRYGPGLPAFPEVHIPSLGDFQVPPPPPPPPPKPLPVSVFNSSVDWVGKHPWKTSGIVLGVVVGTGLLVGYRRPSSRQQRPLSVNSTTSNERKQVVVVLGGDSPYGLPLVRALEKSGYIVIASVSTPEAVEAVEKYSKGYVKALVLDPQEPATVPVFLRSLSSTLSRKFPLKSAGDPYTSPTSQPYIQSIVSLLTLPSTSPAPLGPFEHLSLHNDYLSYLNASQITPLQVIQQLLPLLRTGSVRSQDKGKKSIIVCLPAVDTRVALPFSSVQAMSAAATLRAVEVLRREVGMAALTGKTDSMKTIRVVTVDVGTINTGLETRTLSPENLLKATDDWTSSEKLIYGPAFASVLQQRPPPSSLWQSFKFLFGEHRSHGAGRRPTDMSVFVKKIVSVIGEGKQDLSIPGLGVARSWIRGDNISVGAGARTYQLAAYLPSLLLDALLNLPYFLIGLRNRLLPVQPFRHPPTGLPPLVTPNPRSPLNERRIQERTPQERTPQEPLPSTSTQVLHEEVETRSEPDSEGHDLTSVESSWVSLNQGHSESDFAA